MVTLGPLVRNAFAHRRQLLAEGIPRAFWALLAGTFVTKAGSFVVPMLFIYLTQARGLSLAAAGTTVSLFGVGSLLGGTLGGVLADRIGRRATMLGSLVLGAGFMLVLGVATTPWQLAPATLFLGLTADAYRPASQALVADIVPPEHRMKAFGLQYWAINLGFSFAAAVGGYMARRHFGLLFMGDAATTLVLAAVVWRAVPESRPKPTGEAPSGSLLTPFGDRVFAPFLFLNFVTALIFFQHLTSLPEDMRSKGLSSEQYGMALASNGLLIVLLQPWVTKRVAHVPRARLLAAAAALTGLGYGLTTFARSLGTYVLTVAVWTLGEMIFAPVNGSLVADLSPKHARGRFQGAFSITWSLAFMVSPLVGPRLVEATNLRTLWLVCLVVGLGVGVGHLTVTSRLLAQRSASR